MFTSAWAADSAFDADTDRADAQVVEVSLLWGDTTLSVRHVAEGETLTVGNDCDLEVSLPEGQSPVLVTFSAVGAHVEPGTSASVLVDGWPRDATGGEGFDLGMGHRAEIHLGAFTLRMRVLAAAKATPLTFMDRLRGASVGGVGLSFLVHASIVASLAFFMPSLAADDSEAIDRDRAYAMKAMLDAAAARELERETGADESPANEGEASGGGRAQGAEGAMGKTDPTVKSQGHYAARGDAKPNEVTLQKRELVEMARSFGMNALVGSLAAEMATNAPAVPWDSVQNGMDSVDHNGNLWAQELGDAYGTGLGLSGADLGGGGNNIGIGINDVGGLGRSLDTRLGGGKCLTPPCDGMGRGIGIPRGHHDPKGPTMRAAKTEIEGGRLPAEVIQRIVRLSHGRFRNCYEAGLRTNPSLGGRVAVRFVIDRNGGVTLAADGGSDLPDEGVRKCVVQTFYSLSFPQPENGTVRVTYPLVFAPGE